MPCVPDSSALVALSTVASTRPTTWRSMGANFRGKRAELGAAEVATGLALLAAVLAGVWLLSRLLSKQDRRQPYCRPRMLFGQMCRAHQLDRRNRNLLKQLARHQQLAQPAMLFIEAERFDPARIPSALAGEAAQLAALKDKLFAE